MRFLMVFVCLFSCCSLAINIRGPVQLPSSVLTTLPPGTGTTVSASNLTVANLPAARIIQVQQPTPSGQVLGTGRITAMTLHPLVVNASTVSTANTVRGVSVTTAKPSLTITHVGKVRYKVKTISHDCETRFSNSFFTRAPILFLFCFTLEEFSK